MKYLITGAGGFVGTALTKKLCAEGHTVTALSRRVYPHLQALGATSLAADLSHDPREYIDFFAQVDVVFHVAAKVEMWGRYDDFFVVNVQGTRNVLHCCKAMKVPVCVYTSSPSVIADGTDLRGIDESYPYPTHYDAFYPRTKAQAEREVLAAHCDTLRTLALRPHLIFGPGDTNLIPTVLERARAGKLRQIGAGKNLVDFCYIDDCVTAHLKAAEALQRDLSVGGNPYFISQGDPVPLWEWVRRLLKAHDLTLAKPAVPTGVASCIAALAERVCKILPGTPEPPFTRFLVSEMSTDHFFSIKNARDRLDFIPSVTVWQGLDRTLKEHKG